MSRCNRQRAALIALLAPALMCVGLVVLAIVCIIAGAAFIPPVRDVLLEPAKEALMRTTGSITMGVGP